MQLSPHFSLSEFTNSDKATILKISNDLPIELYSEAKKTAEMMEKIRDYLSFVRKQDISIKVSSGYRCLALNRAIGSKDTSDHPLMMAIDWTAASFGSPYEISSALVPAIDSLGIGQLIHEFGSWVHVSSKIPANPNNRIITISKAGTAIGIQRV